MTRTGGGPWVDLHGHPGRFFLHGLADDHPAVTLLGPPDDNRLCCDAPTAGLAAMSASTVADNQVLGMTPPGRLSSIRDFRPGEAWADQERQLKAGCRTSAAHATPIMHTADDVVRAHTTGRPCLWLAAEGADFLEGRIDDVASLHAAGLRALGLVHYRRNAFADPQTEAPHHGGLSSAGRELVRTLNDVRIVVDLAHASFQSTADAVATSSVPVMLSHTHLAPPGGGHPRLITAEHARVVADSGGVIGAWPSGVTSRTLDDFLDEVIRLVDVVGPGHVGIGTDMDANYAPVVTRYEQFAAIAAGLSGRGLDHVAVDAVMGGNAVALIRAVCG